MIKANYMAAKYDCSANVEHLVNLKSAIELLLVSIYDVQWLLKRPNNCIPRSQETEKTEQLDSGAQSLLAVLSRALKVISTRRHRRCTVSAVLLEQFGFQKEFKQTYRDANLYN